MFRKPISVAVLVLIALSAGCTRSGKVPPRSKAPDFTLQDLAGSQVRLSDLRGKVVLVEFWAAWCPPCRESIPVLERLHRAYGGQGLVVLGIDLDEGSPEDIKAFVREKGMTYTVLKGDDSVTSAYSVRVIPAAYLVNKEGLIAGQFIGGGDERELENDIKALLER